MANVLKVFIILTFVLQLISAEIPVHHNNITKMGQSVTNAPNHLTQVFSKALDELVPLHLRSLASLFLSSVDPKTIFKSVARYIIPTASHNNAISQQCRKDSWLYAESLSNFTEWAVRMFDANGKIPEGIMSDNYHSMGHFDQCLRVGGPDNVKGPKFTGKYCTVFLRPKPMAADMSRKARKKQSLNVLGMLGSLRNVDSELLNMTSLSDLIRHIPSLALCLPSTCSARDIESGLADITASIGLPEINGISIVPFASEDFCTVAGTQRDYDLATIIVLVFYGILATLLVLGTAYDAFLRYKDEECIKDLPKKHCILLSFSVWSNGSKILDTENSAEGELGCLHGIRALSCFWVVLGHTFVRGLDSPNANVAQVQEDVTRWNFQFIANGTLAVDSFFFLSGLLVAYVTVRELDKSKGKLNVFLMYLNRYLRLTPVCVFLLSFFATLLVHLGSGPYWGEIVLQSEACRNSWWYYLSYINNFFYENPNVSSCMGAAWYLAVDLQLYLLSPIFVYALWRRPKHGRTFLGVAIALFTVVSMVIIFSENLPPTFVFSGTVDPKLMRKFYIDYYQTPWCRIMPYLVGIYIGHALYTTQNTIIAMNPWLVGTGWTVAVSIGLSVVFGMYGYEPETNDYTNPVSVSVLYGSLHRTAWAVSLGWLVFACVHGYGGMVNRFLSWSCFIPLSRLAYCTFLVHEHWIGYYNARARTIAYYTATDANIGFLNNLVISLGLAFILSVCVEAPFLQLQKFLIPAKARQSANEPENDLTAFGYLDRKGKGV